MFAAVFSDARSLPHMSSEIWSVLLLNAPPSSTVCSNPSGLKICLIQVDLLFFISFSRHRAMLSIAGLSKTTS